jgi:phage terminase small subunit
MLIDSQKKAELTKKQEMFCRYYAQNGHNRIVAAILAGYSIKTAKDAAYKNIKKPHIVKFINELEKPVNDKLALDEIWALCRLKNFCDVNITDFLDIDPKTNKIRLKDMKKMPAKKTTAIASVKETDKTN